MSFSFILNLNQIMVYFVYEVMKLASCGTHYL
jgi:hypothetical protein